MNTAQIGQKLVEYCNLDQSDKVVDELYADTIVSVELAFDASQGETGIAEGIAAIRDKHTWWNDNHEVHMSVAEGPYLGQTDNEFLIKFTFEVTPAGAERLHMEELGRYTVANGKIAREEFLHIPA